MPQLPLLAPFGPGADRNTLIRRRITSDAMPSPKAATTRRGSEERLTVVFLAWSFVCANNAALILVLRSNLILSVQSRSSDKKRGARSKKLHTFNYKLAINCFNCVLGDSLVIYISFRLDLDKNKFYFFSCSRCSLRQPTFLARARLRDMVWQYSRDVSVPLLAF